MKFHHVGLATNCIKTELDIYRKLGCNSISEIYEDKNLGVKVCFVDLAGLYIELVEPLEKNSPVDNYLKKGVRMYHKCFIAPSMNFIHEKMRNLDAIMVSPPKPAIAFGGKEVVFYFLRNKDLIEFVIENK